MIEMHLLQRIQAPLDRRTATAGLTAMLLGAGVLLGGCGTSSAPRAADPVSRAAYVSTQEAGMRFTLSLQLARSNPSQSFTITGSGYAARGGHGASMTMNFSGIPGATGFPSGGHGVQAVFLYPTVYMRLPFLADKMPEGKSWIEVDMSKVVQATHGAIPQAFGIGQIDPTQFLQYLQAGSGEVRKLGTQQLYGTSTTHYQVKLQLPSVLSKLPAQERTAARPLLEHIANGGSIPFDVWVDGKGRVRQLQISLQITGSMASGSALVTIGFTAYGPVPAVTLPPESEVVNLTGLLSNGLAGTLSG